MSEVIRTVRDPHHNGYNEWGWDGRELYHKAVGVNRWVKVKRIHPTPARIATLNELMKEPTG